MSDKLLPCPFCGGEVKLRGGAEDWTPTFYDPDSGGDPYYIYCECGLSFSIDSYEVEELVTTWNTRKPMERIVERLEEQTDKYADEYALAKVDAKLSKAHRAGGYITGLEKAIEIVKEELAK